MPELNLEEMVIGQRVQLHPATDLWKRGVRYGTVVSTTISNGRDMLMVALDGQYRRQVDCGRPIMLGWDEVLFNW